MPLRLTPTRSTSRQACSLHITEAAAAFLNGIVLGRNSTGEQIVLALAATREDGQIRYSMRLAEISSVPGMLRQTVQGIEVAIDPASVKLLDGLELGFIGGALTVVNPNLPGGAGGAGEMTA